MRNIFDQYTQPENRLTHALVSALAEDEKLLRNFIKWICDDRGPEKLWIVEQQLPGENEQLEAVYEQRGLPDAWIHDNSEWSLLIESKVASPLSINQLERHYRTAERRGFNAVTVLAIDISAPSKALPEYAVSRTWKDVYRWLSRQSSQSQWALKTMRYMEVAERKWPVEGYLKEGALTEFTGIHFDDSSPYNYPEAKRLIRLLMDELRNHPGLVGLIDPDAPGRGAIKGKLGTSVWDYFRLAALDPEPKFDQQPHLTLSIGERHVSPIVILPNAMQARFRKRLLSLEEDGFFELMAGIEKRMRKLCRANDGVKPWISTNQRHHTSRSAPPTIDGDINFDLRTAVKGSKSPVKYQPQWLSSAYELLSEKRSNMSFALGARMPYGDCRKLKSPGIVDSIVATWLACTPLIDVLLDE